MKKRILSIVLTLCMMLALFPATALAEEPKLFDVNGDGIMNILDATLVQKYVVGLISLNEEQLAAADGDGDGNITAYDATVIQMCIAEQTPDKEVPDTKPYDGIKVNATSNFFFEASATVDDKQEYVTVTFFIVSSKDMLNTQWELTYDPDCLEFDESKNIINNKILCMPSVDNLIWNVVKEKGTITANASNVKLYDFANLGSTPFVTATFKVIGSGETTVNLFVDVLTVSSRDPGIGMTDPEQEESFDPAPVISGIENGKTYCTAQTVTVSDNDGIASVTVNGTSVTLDAKNQFTLNPAEGTQTIVATDKAGNETSVTVTVNDGHTDTAPKDHICDECGEIVSQHTGGTATCTEQAICEVCNEPYGELDSSNHNLEKVPAKDATVTETGNIEHWHCLDCGKYFSDENGVNEIELDATITKKLPPEIIEGKGQSVTEGEKKELTFKSNAAFSDFIRVELDGKTLDENNYTVKEGSTVVTLKADYVATLSTGEHTIGIVSTSGTASTTFTVNAKTVVDNDTKSPQTGDNSHMALWLALLFVSGAGVIGTTVYGKKKRAK